MDVLYRLGRATAGEILEALPAAPSYSTVRTQLRVLETKGHDPLEDVKTQAAERWVRAVNAEGSFDEWRYEISHAMNEIPALLDEIAGSALATI